MNRMLKMYVYYFLMFYQVFKVFGEIREVSVEALLGYALVTFVDIVAAFFAQQSLDNFYLAKYNA